MWATRATGSKLMQGPTGDSEPQSLTGTTPGPQGALAEALPAQMERAKTEHAQMALALQASQACALEQRQQLEDLRAQLSGAKVPVPNQVEEGGERLDAECLV